MTSHPESPPTKPSFADTVAQLFPPKVENPNLAVEDAGNHRRRKLWEIEFEHHCIVIGTCISLPELRKLARQAEIAEWNTATDYELHRIAVSAARERTPLSTLMHKELERKFPHVVRRFSGGKSDDEIRAEWKSAFSRGEVTGPLWAIMTHPMASSQTLSTASEELHMLSHQVGAASRADLKRLAELEQENRTLRDQLARYTSKTAAQLAEKDALIGSLEARAAEATAARRRCEQAEARLRALENAAVMLELERRLVDQTRRAQRAEARAADLADVQARCERLEAELAEARRQAQAAENMLQSVLDERDRAEEAPAPPPCMAELAGRCVLCVGGRTGLVDQYRSVVERCHGEFAHHDGGFENNVGRLQSLLASADAVICQSGNVSHAAYYVVKRYCKQHGKPCVLLKNSALSSFLKGLRALAGSTEDETAMHGVLLGSSTESPKASLQGNP